MRRPHLMISGCILFFEILSNPAIAFPIPHSISEFPFSSASATDTLPSNFPTFTINILEPTAPARIFVAAISRGAERFTYLTILDETLTPIYYAKRPEGNSDFKQHSNGLITFFDNGVRCHYVMNASYAIIDSIRTVNGYVTDGHDIVFTPEGHVLLMSYDIDTVDMSVVVPGGQPNAAVTGLVLQELDGNKNLVFQWRSWDHFSITDATHIDLTASTIDYVHANAFEIDSDGNILLSSRHMDEITKIDRATGAIIWRWGGKNNQFTFINDSLKFFYQHDVRRIANGHITLFDNGNFHAPAFSRAVEYVLNEQAKTATLVWEFRDSMKVYAPATGNVQRLPNGNTFISWGTTRIVTEVRPDGTKAMEFVISSSFTTYRTFRYAIPATSAPMEIYKPATFRLDAPFPNPFNGSAQIAFELMTPSVIRLDVVNVLGQTITVLVDEFRGAGKGSVRLDAEQFASGIYLIRMVAQGRTTVRKVLLMR